MSNNIERKEIGITDKLTVGQSLFYGFQSVVALNLFLGAIIIAGILGLDIAHTAILLTLSFLACGVATLIQAGIFMKYPVVQGVSFATIGAIVAITFMHDLATAFGSLILGAIIIILLGYFKLFSKIMKIIPPIVAGVVVCVIGVSVMFTAADSLITFPGSAGTNFLLAAIVFALIFIFKTIGNSKSKIAGFCGKGGVLMAIVIACIVAGAMGVADFGPVAAAPIVGAPEFFAFGFPKFDLASSLVFIFIYIIVMIETIGNWFAISFTAKAPIQNADIDKGIIGEGVGSLIGAFIGSAPATSYAPNCGVISLTKVYSRWSAVGAGVIIVILAFIPKLMYVIACIPGPIMLGTLFAMTVIILMSGFRSIHHYPLSERNILIIGIPIAITLLVSLMPMDIVGAMPMLLSFLFSSSICIGTIAAVLLNLILPKAKAEDAPAEIASETPALEEPAEEATNEA